MNSPARMAELIDVRDQQARQDSGRPRDKPIGAILLDAGLITLEDAERIAIHARVRKLRFGDAAVDLGKVSAEALQRALAFQFDYPVVHPGTTG